MIRAEDQGNGVRLLTIDRHERRNALDIDHLDELHRHVTEARDDGSRAVVITGAGTAFSAGADLDGVYGGAFRTALYRTLAAITQAPVPVIAAVNGPAIGAGAQVAIACDLRVGHDRARFAIPTARNGLAVDPWTVRRLALLTNGAVARTVLLAASTIEAEQAQVLGLLSRSGNLEDALDWAREIAALAPLSVAYSKRALEVLLEPTLPGADLDELDGMFARCWESDDVSEGQAARAENRPPVFNGR